MCTNQSEIQNYILNDAVYSSFDRALSVYKACIGLSGGINII